MSIMNKGFDSEKLSGIQGHISGVQSNISAINANLIDFTSVQILTAVNITSGGGVNGTGAIRAIGGWAVNNLWIDLTSPTVNAASSGCEVRIFGRAASATVWSRFITNSNLISSTYLIPIRGSGTNMSGAYYYGDLKVEVVNASSSGTAIVSAYVMSKRQN